MLFLGRVFRLIIPFSFFAFAMAYALVLFTYSSADPGWNNLNSPEIVSNLGGIPGAYIADISFYLFGFVSFLIPICVIQFLWNYRIKWKSQKDRHILNPVLFFVGFLLVLLGACGLENLYGNYSTNFRYGGILGFEVARAVEPYMEAYWGAVLFSVLSMAGMSLVGIPWFRVIEMTGSAVLSLFPIRKASKAEDIREMKIAPKHPTSSPRTRVRETKKRQVEADSIPRRAKRTKPLAVTKKDSKLSKRSWFPKQRKAKVSYKKTLERRDPVIQPIWNLDADDKSSVQAESMDSKSNVENLTNGNQQFVDREHQERENETHFSDREGNREYVENKSDSGDFWDDSFGVDPIDNELLDEEKYRQEQTIYSDEMDVADEPDNESNAFPDTSVLDQTGRSKFAYSQTEIIEIGQKLEAMLADFNVPVKVRDAKVGPVITQFEIEPAAGIKANRIVNLASDLARTLTVQSVRVVENVPGSPYVGVEVPNKKRDIVQLVDGLESSEYGSSDHPLTIVLGKDIRGNTVITNLESMPHLLIAGTTGAGKSVCLNAVLLSFLFKSTPEDLRLIMIDPKMLEFSVYEGIPHLLAPVITDMRKTENALKWCISEMERRFTQMAHIGVRNMENFNEQIRNSEHPVLDPNAPDPSAASPLKPFPYIVVIIDELSDLIMVLGRKAEELIIRIAQRARAAGIHLIVATQRPSTDIIRGVLKANIPTRIGFKVASNADSRTILDQAGAENLLGKGDMLFIPPGSAVAQRVHGAFVSDDEVKRVVDSIKMTSFPQYDQSVELALEGNAGTANSKYANNLDHEEDELYGNALDFVLRTRRPTISSVQRHLRVGYNRAARIIESMEKAGVVSPAGAGGKRKILIPKPQD